MLLQLLQTVNSKDNKKLINESLWVPAKKNKYLNNDRKKEKRESCAAISVEYNLQK